MHVLIGGGSGFIGTAVSKALRARGDRVTIISRNAALGAVTWADIRDTGLPQCDAVINLAGQHILNLRRRWDAAYKNEVITSRVETTKTLVNAINASSSPPQVFVSTAGKCFYGTSEIDAVRDYPELDENSEPMGMDFPAELVGLWEKAAEGIDASRIRHVKLRIGVVLGAVERKSHIGRLWQIGRARGFLPIIRLPFCLGLGATIGKGIQPFPWIHIDDMVGIILHTIDTPSTEGKYNAVSPGIVSNRLFTEAFAKALRRPIRLNIPEWVIRRVVGDERSSILLQGQLVRPKRTLESGYRFQFPDVSQAMTDLVKITF